MAITDKEIRALKAEGKKLKRGCGDGLRIEVRPTGVKYFYGRIKDKDHYVGSYPDLSLKEARQAWMKIKVGVAAPSRSGRTLADLVTRYLSSLTIRPSQIKDYSNKINKDILPMLGASTDLRELEFDNGGREKLIDMKRRIEGRGSLVVADRTFMVARQMFELAIDIRWMKGENPAMKSRFTDNGHISKPHPTIPFSQLGELLADLEESNTALYVKRAIKLELLSFVRAHSLVQMQWDQLIFDHAPRWVIPADTQGLKRKKGSDIDHVVPLTDGAVELIDLMRFNDHQAYVFKSVRKSQYPYLNPTCMNRALQNIAGGKYQRALTFHGLRALVTTAGMEVLETRYEVVDKLLGHVTAGDGGKIRKAYDRTEWFQERLSFLKAWEAELFKLGFQIS